MSFVAPPYIRAIIFDLDGVLTDTAEYHFQAWKRLADEEGIPFTRQDNEKLRGVSRRRSLELLLGDRKVSEEAFQEMMERKNAYYREMLQQVTPADLLPGVPELLRGLREAGLKIAIASASKNAGDVVDRLGIRDQIDVLADGFSPGRPKPAPDLFLYAAEQLGVPPVQCVCVEDAAAGIDAGNAAGMVTVGIGPVERVGHADLVVPSLEGVEVADLLRPATWRVAEYTFDPMSQHQYETILAQGNGYLGTRATFEEGFPSDWPATLIHGLWDDIPLVFTEIANAPNWTELEILINGERFSLAAGQFKYYARYLDLRTGVLHRRVRWQPSEDGPVVDLIFERVPSLVYEHAMGVRLRIEPIDQAVDVEVRAPIDAIALNPGFLQEGINHWDRVDDLATPEEAALMLRTRHTHKVVALCTRLNTSGVASVQEGALDVPGRPTVTRRARVEPGETFVADKFVAIYTSRDEADPMEASRKTAQAVAEQGYDAIREDNDRAWAEFWQDSDVIIEGDDEAQLSIRHALFQLRASATYKDERVSIGAKALTGFGYRAHVFWDTDIFILPFFTYTQPEFARAMLMYRWHTLPGARRNARSSGYIGARYAWESAETGDEITPTWVPDPASRKGLIRILTGDIEIHITADVAYAIWQYWQTTGDDEFMRLYGAPIILETAVFWGDRVEEFEDGYGFLQVIGPDEYHESVDNNAFTNRMVQWHLETALRVREWLYEVAPEEAQHLDAQLEITEERLDHWQDIIDNMIFLYDEESGLIEQFEGFFDLQDIDWSEYEGRTASMQALLGMHGIQKYQVIKQPDVILLLCLLRNEFGPEVWRANWDYYVPRTDHEYGSSLGPSIHAWAACEVGKPDEGYEHFMRAARADLRDIRRNVEDGIHAASAGGLWQAIAFGFAGLRFENGSYTLSPRLPSHWKRLAFSFYLNGERHQVDLRAEELAAQAASTRKQMEG